MMPTVKDDIPSTNGARRGPSQEERRTASGYVATARTEADRRATAERIRGLRERIAYFEGACRDGRDEVASAEQHRDGIQQHGRGWPLEMVAVLAIVTIALEYLPATLFTQIFSNDYTTWRLLTITFTVIPAVLALAFGELLHRLREPARQQLIDTMLLITVALATIVFLAIGYKLRIAYTTATGHGIHNLESWVEAIALTSVATIGILLTVVSGYYREGLEMFKSRWALSRHRDNLRTNEACLKANQRDLERAVSALRGEASVRSEVSDRPDGTTARAEADNPREDSEVRTSQGSVPPP